MQVIYHLKLMKKEHPNLDKSIILINNVKMKSKFESFSFYPRKSDSNSSLNNVMRTDGEFHSDLDEIKSRI